MTVIDYKGYRIELTPIGKGWRASIFSPGSTSPWPNSTVNLEKSGAEEIVAEAKRIIEVRLALLWQIYSSCMFAQIHFRQCGHRCGGSRAMSATMA